MVGRIATVVLLCAVEATAPFDSARAAEPRRLAQDQQTNAARKQAVLDTSAGPIVMDLLADRAPNHVALFIKTAESGAYDGTTFFRMIKHGIIQGGDPVTKDPAARGRYGTGGLNILKAESNDEKQTRGAVSATQIPGKADSAGTQFFIAVTDQPGLDGRYTIFARVVEGRSEERRVGKS